MIQLHITPAEVRSWNPCSGYTDDRIATLFAGRSTLTAREIAALEIPARDRVWALCRVMAFRCPGTIKQFTEWCAGRAQDAAAASVGAYDAAAAAAAADAAYAYAAAAVYAAPYAAAAAPYAAPYAAAADAAARAAADTAYAAADAAARAAADAAYAAADAAARAAYAAADAGCAERTAQIAFALELIEGKEMNP